MHHHLFVQWVCTCSVVVVVVGGGGGGGEDDVVVCCVLDEMFVEKEIRFFRKRGAVLVRGVAPSGFAATPSVELEGFGYGSYCMTTKFGHSTKQPTWKYISCGCQTLLR